MELITVCLIFSLFIILFWKTHLCPLAQKLNKFPGPFTYPIIGNSYQVVFVKGLSKFVSSQFTIYNGCYRFWMFFKPFLLISDHRVGEILLSSSKQTERAVEPSEMYLGEGLITSTGETWRQDRKELNNSFSQTFINRFIDTFNHNAQMLLDDLKEVSKSTNCPTDLNPLFSKWTLNVVLESSMGKLSSAVHGLNKDDSLNAIKTMIESLHKLTWKPWLGLPFIRDIFGTVKDDTKYVYPLQKKLYNIIDEQRVLFERQTGSSKLRTFVDILLDGKQQRSTQNIVDHVFTLLAAGTDTSTLCMNFTLFLLANNPEHQRLVHEELDSIFRNRGKDDMYTTIEDIGDMKYLEMCIKEALRLYPPAPIIPRHIKNDIPIDETRVIPKGCIAVIVLADYHRDPKVFPNPENFNPNRFTPEECAKRSPYDYLPFSGGSRTCIGQKYAIMEIKLFLSYILRHFQIKTNMTTEEVQVEYSIALIPQQSLMLQLVKREL